jgi:hypothetical protein
VSVSQAQLFQECDSLLLQRGVWGGSGLLDGAAAHVFSHNLDVVARIKR